MLLLLVRSEGCQGGDKDDWRTLGLLGAAPDDPSTALGKCNVLNLDKRLKY